MLNRPILRYPGGKFKIAPWIIKQFPPISDYNHYIEPCGGAASVLMQKPPSPLETYNDIDNRVVNFFFVLREHPSQLVKLIELTPWSRVEFERCREKSPDCIEDARRFLVLCWQSISRLGGHWRITHDYSKRPSHPMGDNSIIDQLYFVAERLKTVQLENRPALDVISRFSKPDSLIYFDPPYLMKTRSRKKLYTYETDDEFHTQAAILLKGSPGYVVVSGYASEMYVELYESAGWLRLNSSAVATNGGCRVESLWLNPKASQKLPQSNFFEVLQ